MFWGDLENFWGGLKRVWGDLRRVWGDLGSFWVLQGMDPTVAGMDPYPDPEGDVLSWRGNFVRPEGLPLLWLAPGSGGGGGLAELPTIEPLGRTGTRQNKMTVRCTRMISEE